MPLQHVVKTPSDSSYMHKKCKLEAKRYHDTHHYVPKWKRHFTATSKQTRKCMHPQCLATEKLIHASCEDTENLEAALGIISSPDNLLLLCRDHYIGCFILKQSVLSVVLSGGFRAARLPGQATCAARVVSLWVEKNPVPLANHQALDRSVVLTVGWLYPIVPQDNIVVNNKHN